MNRPPLGLLPNFVLMLSLLAACSGLSADRDALPENRSSASLEGVSAEPAMVFVPNAGQNASDVLFGTLEASHRLYFSRNEIVLPLRLPRRAADLLSAAMNGLKAEPSESTKRTTIQLRFEGANERVRVVGRNALPGVVNYIFGNDPDAWYLGIPTYAGLAYENLYEDIDLVFTGRTGVLKGTFEVDPGGNPDSISWHYDGASDVSLRGGELLITPDGEPDRSPLVERQPVAWQDAGGERRFVDIRYVRNRGGGIKFAVGRYDNEHPLIIDPTLDYSTYVGGSGSEEGCGIGVDADDNVYVTGVSDAASFPSSRLAGALGDYETSDAFVTKLDPSLTGLHQMVYHTYVGGSDFDNPTWIDVDAAGKAYVVGYTFSDDFPTTAGAYQSTAPGDTYNGMVFQLDAAGAVEYATYLAGNSFDEFAQGVVRNGLLYAVGHTQSSDFPTTPDAYQSCGNGVDAAVSILDTTASGTDSLVYSTCFGGSATEEGLALDVDSGIVYFAGRTHSSNLPTKNPLQASNAGGIDLYLAKLDPAQPGAAQLLFASYFGGTDSDTSGGVSVEDGGRVFWTGGTESSDFPTTPGSPAHGGGDFDAFLVALETDPVSLIYSRLVGGDGNDAFRGILTDGASHVFVTGGSGSTNFPTVDPLQATFKGGVAPEVDLAYYGPGDPVVAKFDPTGTMVFGTYLGGTGADTALGIAFDSNGDVYVTGGTRSTDFPTFNAYQDVNRGEYDIFIARLGGLTDCIAPRSVEIAGPDPPALRSSTRLTATVSPLASQQPITYTWSGSAGVSLNTTTHTSGLTDTVVVTWTAAGLQTISVSAVNACGAITSTHPFSVTNQRPIAAAGPDLTVGVRGIGTLDGSASSDPDGHLPLSYLWAQIGGPAVPLDAETAMTTTFRAPAAPTVLTFTLTVTDAEGLASLPDDVMTSVEPWAHEVFLPLVSRD